MRVGYIGHSNDSQKVESQTKGIRQARCQCVFIEQASHFGRTRTVRASCLRSLNAGDRLVVFSLNDLASSRRELVQILTGLEERGIEFISLSEGVNTKFSMGKLLVEFLTALVEFELKSLSARTLEGLRVAKENGRMGGNKKKTSKAEDQKLITLWRTGNYTKISLAAITGLSLSTVDRRLAEHKQLIIARSPRRANSAKPVK